MPDLSGFYGKLCFYGGTNNKGRAVIFGPDGDEVATVRGMPNDGWSAEDAAAAIVEACNRAAKTWAARRTIRPESPKEASDA